MAEDSKALPEDCWDGYKMVGMKKKGKKTVPNCVPEEKVTEKRALMSLRDYIDLVEGANDK